MRSVKNIIFTTGTMGLPLVVSLVTVPIYLSLIGAERYGALAISWLLLGYVAQADFGIGKAVTQRISAMAVPDRCGPAAARVVWSATAIAVVIGTIGAILTYIAADLFFSRAFQVDDTIRSELLEAILLLALSSPLVNLASIATGALIGAERLKLVATLNMATMLSLQIAPLIAAYYLGPDLSILVAAAFLARLVTALPALAMVWFQFLSNQPKTMRLSEIKRLGSFGIWVMVSALVGPFMVIFDRFAIGAMLGAVAVAAYTIPFQIASRAMVVPAAVNQVLFPKFASGTEERAHEQAVVSIALMGTIFAPLIAALVTLADPLLRLWLGDELDERSILIGQIVLLGWWANGVAQIPFSLVLARGNSRFAGMVHVIELPFYLGLLFLLGMQFGLPGIALAFALRCAVDACIFAGKARLAGMRTWMRLAVPVTVLALAFLAGNEIRDMTTLLALAGSFIAILVLWTWFLMPQDMRFWLLSMLPLSQDARRRLANRQGAL